MLPATLLAAAIVLATRSGEDFGSSMLPAPYAARYHWVSVQKPGALKQAEIKRLIKDSYEMVKGKLSKKTQSLLGQSESKSKPKA